MASGGSRPGAGRRAVADRRVVLTARVLPATLEKLKKIKDDTGASLGCIIDRLTEKSGGD